MYVKPIWDPNYTCDGIYAFFHWVDGYTPKRHIRLAVSLQLGKDITLNKGGGMCFWATRGLKPEPWEETEEEKMRYEQMNLMEKLLADSKGPKIHDFYEFNEGKEWF